MMNYCNMITPSILQHMGTINELFFPRSRPPAVSFNILDSIDRVIISLKPEFLEK